MEHVVVSHRLEAVTTEGVGTVVAYSYRENQKLRIPDELRRRIQDLEASC